MMILLHKKLGHSSRLVRFTHFITFLHSLHSRRLLSRPHQIHPSSTQQGAFLPIPCTHTMKMNINPGALMMTVLRVCVRVP